MYINNKEVTPKHGNISNEELIAELKYRLNFDTQFKELFNKYVKS